MLTDFLVDTLNVALPFAYATLVGLYGLSFFSDRPLGKARSALLIGTVAGHGVYIRARTVAFDHPPVTTVFEIMTLLALCIALAYLYIEVRTKVTTTGFFIFTLALVFQSVSSVYIKDLADISPILRSRLLGFHVTAALLGYTAVTLSAVYGFLYLMLYHDIKSSHFGVVYKRLPSLEMLETMSHRSIVFGFIMLTIAIAVGLFWLPRVFESYPIADPKLIGSLIIWATYAVGLAAKRRLGWQGRRMMILSLIGFGFVFLSMTVVNVYWSAFHGFY